MQIGDLVKLSAYGDKSNQNYRARGGYGLIVKKLAVYSHYPYKVLWYLANGNETMLRFHRRELKRFKAVK